MKIEGFVGKPEIARGNRSFENYYINGRYVKNNIINIQIVPLHFHTKRNKWKFMLHQETPDQKRNDSESICRQFFC